MDAADFSGLAAVFVTTARARAHACVRARAGELAKVVADGVDDNGTLLYSRGWITLIF